MWTDYKNAGLKCRRERQISSTFDCVDNLSLTHSYMYLISTLLDNQKRWCPVEFLHVPHTVNTTVSTLSTAIYILFYWFLILVFFFSFLLFFFFDLLHVFLCREVQTKQKNRMQFHQTLSLYCQTVLIPDDVQICTSYSKRTSSGLQWSLHSVNSPAWDTDPGPPHVFWLKRKHFNRSAMASWSVSRVMNQ